MSPKQSTFELSPWRGVWRVTFDDVFYGDYRSEHAAIDAIEDARKKLVSTSRVVRIEERPV